MNIRVVYHSSTGNTEKVARAIAGALNVEAEPLGEETAGVSASVDLLFIGDGIYFGKANKKTIAFIDRLSPGAVKNAAVFATHGGQSKIGANIAKLLQNKGIRVVNEPFTCKGKSWKFINGSRPNKADLDMAREYARATLAKVTE